MKDIINIAIVGFGGIAGWHSDKIAEIDCVNLVGVFDIDESRHIYAQKKGIKTYASFDELLADKNVDVVTVAAPNDVHLDLVCKALNAGKHVVCEKPVALNSTELVQMIECAKKNDRLFTVHQNRRWDEDYLTVKKIFDDNMLGKVFNIESRVHGSRGIPSDWRNQKKHGGGMILDWGVHILDQIVMMLKDKKLISLYNTLSHVTNTEVDDGFCAKFIFEDEIGDKLSVTLEVGTSNFINLPRWYMQGENGTAVINNWDLDGEIVMVSDWENRDAVPVVTAAGLTKTMAPRTSETIKRYPLPSVKSDIRDFYRNVCAVITQGAEPLVKTDEVLRVMHLMEAMFQSAYENKSILFE